MLRGTLCKFVAMATAQNLMHWFDLQNVCLRGIFKVRKFQLDILNRFRMMEEKQEGGGSPQVR